VTELYVNIRVEQTAGQSCFTDA